MERARDRGDVASSHDAVLCGVGTRNITKGERWPRFRVHACIVFKFKAFKVFSLFCLSSELFMSFERAYRDSGG